MPLDSVTADQVATGDLSGYDSLVVADLAALPHGSTVTREQCVDGSAGSPRAAASSSSPTARWRWPPTSGWSVRTTSCCTGPTPATSTPRSRSATTRPRRACSARSAVATVEGDTALGSAPLGDGSVTVFGSVLPQAAEEYPHPHGLASYGVTIAGGQVLDDVLSHRRP